MPASAEPHSVCEPLLTVDPAEEEEAKLPAYASVASIRLHGALFRRLFHLLRDTILASGLTPTRCSKPEVSLDSLFPFSLENSGIGDHDALLDLLARVIQLTPPLQAPFSLSSHSNGLDVYGIAAEFISCVMSSPVVSYFAAPVFTLMEEELKARLCDLCGWTEGDGIFCPGDAFANLLALRLAIHHMIPDARARGLSDCSTRPVIFLSAHAQSDWENAAAITGLGSSVCVRLPTDSHGRMELQALRLEIERFLEQGSQPFMVVATAGTPFLGAIDPIQGIADVCGEFGMWLHVDGAFGASYLLHEGHTGRLLGVNRSDSLSWSPSGMLGAPSCSTLLLTPHSTLPQTTFGLQAPIVYEETSLYDGKWDNGDRHIQTCRRPDVLKPWLMWKAKGQDGLAAHVKYADELAHWTLTQLKARADFYPILDVVDAPRLAFYFQSQNPGHLSTSEIAEAVHKAGILDLDVVSMTGHPDCYSMALNNPLLRQAHITFVLDTIEHYGRRGPEELAPTWLEEKPELQLSPSFWDNLFELILDNGLFFHTEKARAEPALIFQKPEDLMKIFDFRLEKGGRTEAEVLDILANVICFSLHQSHPRCRNQLLSSGLDPYSIMADLVTSITSTPMLSRKDSAVYRRMEEEVIRAARKKLGFSCDGDGMVVPGGSVAIMTAIHAARALKFPQTLQKGLLGLRLVLFISENGHYANNKATILEGIGLENCILVKVDGEGRMIVAELHNRIQECRAAGGVPFMVTATAGTTASGVFDPIEAIARICDLENLWLHVDGSLGASLIFSDRLSAIHLKGIQHADSVNLNPHKMFGCPLEMSLLLFKQEGVVKQSFKTKHGNHTAGFQSDRRPNIFKFWFLWKAKGSQGLKTHLEHIYELADLGVDELSKRADRFIPWKHPLETPSLIFQYVPLSLRGLDRTTSKFQEAVNRVAFPLMEMLIRRGVISIGALRNADGAVVNKLVIMSSGTRAQDIANLLDLIDHYGQHLDT